MHDHSPPPAADPLTLRSVHDHRRLKAHDLNDALAMLRIVQRHTRTCFIGRDDQRPNRDDYIMTNWE